MFAEVDAAQGLVLAKTNPVVCDNQLGDGANTSGATEPMMKLAMYCATKGEGTSNERERPKETSSEGSSTEGGC